MIQIKDKAVGIDVAINDIQRSVFEALEWENYNAYHRVYKNEKVGGGVIPEFYSGSNDAKSGEYEEVYLNDNLNASSFFYVDDTRPTTGNGRINTPTIHMVFQVDLSAIDGDNSRNDEDVHRKVALAVNDSLYGKVTNIVTGISSVYSDFDTSQIRWDDMQPFHCFRVDIDVSYQYDCCDNCIYQSPITGNEYLLI